MTTITYTVDELAEAIELVKEAEHTDDLQASAWARAAKILLQDRENYYRRIEPEEGALVQYLGVYALNWPWHSGIKPTDAFVEVEK